MGATTRPPAVRRARPSRLRRAAGHLVPAAALFGLAGCGLTSVEIVQPDDVIVVEGYLRPGSSHEVLLYRTLPGKNGSLKVHNATVRIAGPGGAQVQLLEGATACTGVMAPPEIEGSCYAVSLSSLHVVPGETYTLTVTTEDGRTLTGTTTVPTDFEMRVPAVDSCVLGSGPLELTWTRSEGAWSYQTLVDFTNLAPGLAALGVENPPDELQLTGLSIGGADTTIVFPNEFGVFDRFTLDRAVALALQQGLPPGARADIVVAAGDRNYVNWVRGGNFNPSGQIRVASITGDGTGVFGSLTAHRIIILSQAAGVPSCQ